MHPSDLALLGGQPSFPAPVHVGRPNIGDRARLLERIEDILDRRWLSNNGTYVQAFEREVARLAGTRHCVAMCNGTVALEIAIRALELKGEVIVPAFTFVATPHALQWQEITPVFADIDPETHLIDPASVRGLVTPRTSAILGVHLWGQVCDVAALQHIADEHHLRLLFDAAHAFGCSAGGRPVGGAGAVEVFSFHATKFVNSLEGGAVVTDDDDLARRMRLMKNFGFRGYDDVGFVGTNGKMNEFSAAMGLTSLEAMPDFVAANRAHHLRYLRGLAGLPGLSVLRYRDLEATNCQYLVVELDPSACPLRRDELLDLLWSENVQARRYFYPGCHQMEPYRSNAPNARLWLPNTERVAERVLLLPTGPSLAPGDVDRICEVIALGLANAEAVAAALRTSTLPRHPRRAGDRPSAGAQPASPSPAPTPSSANRR